FKRLSVENLDGRSRAVNVKLFAVARYGKVETRTTLEFMLLDQFARRDVEDPELRAARGFIRRASQIRYGVSRLAVRRQTQPRHPRPGRPDRSEIQMTRSQFEPRDPEDAAAHNRIGGIKD